jgi:hypothetical protein
MRALVCRSEPEQITAQKQLCSVSSHDTATSISGMPHSEMKSIGVLLLITGAFLLAGGLLLLFSDKIPWLGNLPGDLHFNFNKVRIHLPLMSCLLISLVLTILVNVILRFLGK